MSFESVRSNFKRNLVELGLALSLITAPFLMRAEAHSATHLSGLRNPLIRVCVINQGVFEVQPNGPTDDIALCRFNSAVIDSQSLLSILDGVRSQAAGVILGDIVAGSCSELGAGQSVLANGQVLCRFSDQSALSLDAAKVGLSDPDRLLLKSGLSTR